MALTKETTSSIVVKYGEKDTDTGNVKVQIALLTERIKQLTEYVPERRERKARSIKSRRTAQKNAQILRTQRP